MSAKTLYELEGETVIEKMIRVFINEDRIYGPSGIFQAELVLLQYFEVLDIPYAEAVSTIKAKSIDYLRDLEG